MQSGIFDRYLAGNARAFFDGHYRDASERPRRVERAARALAPEVCGALEAQNARFAPSAARAAHLAALRSGCAAVVTGQQVGLFLGPLFTVYKAASAIAVARALQRESGQTVVPVFWLQTEDHDLPEVAGCGILTRGGQARSVGFSAAASARVSLAHLTIPSEIEQCLGVLREELGQLPQAEAHLCRLDRHYRAGAPIGQAFAGLLAELFADEGLVLFDPRRPELATACAEIHRRALLEARPIARALCQRVTALEQAGFRAGVHVRPEAPLSFFHPRASQGPRYRLAAVEDDGSRYAEIGGEHTHDVSELLGVLAEDPLRFSTSALLRPILQDSLLPTAAYVGGPGEINYFAQLPPLYAAFGLQMPLIVPRARFRVIEEKTQRLLARLGMDAARATASLETLLSAAVASDESTPEPAEFERRLQTGVDDALRAALQGLPPLGSELDAAIAKTRAALSKPLAKLAQKYASARLHRNQATVQDVQRVQTLLYPDGQPQERYYGLPYFAARYGERAFLERVLGCIEPFDATLRDLSP